MTNDSPGDAPLPPAETRASSAAIPQGADLRILSSPPVRPRARSPKCGWSESLHVARPSVSVCCSLRPGIYPVSGSRCKSGSLSAWYNSARFREGAAQMRDPAHTGLSSDFRSRLVIDRYSSVLSNLPSRRRASLADAGSPDAEIWNVFRTLAQLDPSLWLPRLLALGGIRLPLASDELAAGVGVTLWKRIKPPPERLAWLRQRALRGELRPPVGRKRRGRVI